MESRQFFLSPELAFRFAAIDIGTNSIRLIVAEGLRHGNYRILDDEKEAARLGKNLSSTGRLDPEAIELALQTLRRMKRIAEGYQVHKLRAIGTCAVREAADGPEFCRRAQDELGLSIEVISAEEEARLAFLGVSRAFDLEGKQVAVVDIGGGSTEIVLASGSLIEQIYTTPLGAVRLTELYGGDQALDAEQFARLNRGIDRVLRKQTRKKPITPHMLIGSGGTFTTLAAVIMASKGQQELPVRGYSVTHAEVTHLVDRLRRIGAKARRAVPGLSADRADIITAGVAIIDRVMRRFGVNRLQVHTGGVRDGMLLAMLDEALGGAPEQRPDRQLNAQRLAAACGVDVGHCRHVRHLAADLFDQLVPVLGLDPDDRWLLEAAATLQDVGYLINYEGHHKHSYHLILNSRLTGFEPRDLELIANVARYHRGSKPKKKHAPFRKLSGRDRLRVRQLAAILRLATGLDRSHAQPVEAVRVAAGKGQITLHLTAAQMPDVDAWGARRRAGLFEDVFNCEVVIEWQDPADAQAIRLAPAEKERTREADTTNQAGSSSGRRTAAKRAVRATPPTVSRSKKRAAEDHPKNTRGKRPRQAACEKVEAAAAARAPSPSGKGPG